MIAHRITAWLGGGGGGACESSTDDAETDDDQDGRLERGEHGERGERAGAAPVPPASAAAAPSAARASRWSRVSTWAVPRSAAPSRPFSADFDSWASDCPVHEVGSSSGSSSSDSSNSGTAQVTPCLNVHGHRVAPCAPPPAGAAAARRGTIRRSRSDTELARDAALRLAAARAPHRAVAPFWHGAAVEGVGAAADHARAGKGKALADALAAGGNGRAPAVRAKPFRRTASALPQSLLEAAAGAKSSAAGGGAADAARATAAPVHGGGAAGAGGEPGGWRLCIGAADRLVPSAVSTPYDDDGCDAMASLALTEPTFASPPQLALPLALPLALCRRPVGDEAAAGPRLAHFALVPVDAAMARARPAPAAPGHAGATATAATAVAAAIAAAECAAARARSPSALLPRRGRVAVTIQWPHGCQHTCQLLLAKPIATRRLAADAGADADAAAAAERARAPGSARASRVAVEAASASACGWGEPDAVERLPMHPEAEPPGARLGLATTAFARQGGVGYFETLYLKPGRYEFAFEVDGRFRHDPAQPIAELPPTHAAPCPIVNAVVAVDEASLFAPGQPDDGLDERTDGYAARPRTPKTGSAEWSTRAPEAGELVAACKPPELPAHLRSLLLPPAAPRLGGELVGCLSLRDPRALPLACDIDHCVLATELPPRSARHVHASAAAGRRQPTSSALRGSRGGAVGGAARPAAGGGGDGDGDGDGGSGGESSDRSSPHASPRAPPRLPQSASAPAELPAPTSRGASVARASFRWRWRGDGDAPGGGGGGGERAAEGATVTVTALLYKPPYKLSARLVEPVSSASSPAQRPCALRALALALAEAAPRAAESRASLGVSRALAPLLPSWCTQLADTDGGDDVFAASAASSAFAGSGCFLLPPQRPAAGAAALRVEPLLAGKAATPATAPASPASPACPASPASPPCAVVAPRASPGARTPPGSGGFYEFAGRRVSPRNPLHLGGGGGGMGASGAASAEPGSPVAPASDSDLLFALD